MPTGTMESGEAVNAGACAGGARLVPGCTAVQTRHVHALPESHLHCLCKCGWLRAHPCRHGGSQWRMLLRTLLPCNCQLGIQTVSHVAVTWLCLLRMCSGPNKSSPQRTACWTSGSLQPCAPAQPGTCTGHLLALHSTQSSRGSTPRHSIQATQFVNAQQQTPMSLSGVAPQAVSACRSTTGEQLQAL